MTTDQSRDHQCHHDGTAIVTRPAEGAIPDGQPVAVATHGHPAPEDGDTLVLPRPAPQDVNAPPTRDD
jgi:hypothetical protein